MNRPSNNAFQVLRCVCQAGNDREHIVMSSGAHSQHSHSDRNLYQSEQIVQRFNQTAGSQGLHHSAPHGRRTPIASSNSVTLFVVRLLSVTWCSGVQTVHVAETPLK